MREPQHRVPTAREIMTASLITLDPNASVLDAIRTFLKNEISGAPVVDDSGRMVGMISELDCIRVLAAGEFYSDDHREEGVVADCMTTAFKHISPDVDLYTLAQRFLTQNVRRLPVLDGDELIGQISRRDVLRAMEELGEKRVPRKRYPDYREPSDEVGARRAHTGA